MASLSPTVKLNFLQLQTIPPSNSMKKVGLKPAFCSAAQRVELQEEKVGILCEPCSGTGWLLCDFCNGQKTNVKSKTNRIYRRCPTCKAMRVMVSNFCFEDQNLISRHCWRGERLINPVRGRCPWHCVGYFFEKAQTRVWSSLFRSPPFSCSVLTAEKENITLLEGGENPTHKAVSRSLLL